MLRMSAHICRLHSKHLNHNFRARRLSIYFTRQLERTSGKNEFLRIAGTYLFLVKKGDWHISVPKFNAVIDYFTNSYKLVALFSLIESLTDLPFKDFHEWLSEHPDLAIFPICDKAHLKSLHDDYKKDFGSIRRCVSFFENLPPYQKAKLCNAIRPNGKPTPTIKRLAQTLYNLRSKFVHQAELVLQISNIPILSMENNRVVHNDLPIEILLEAFEQGLLAYFNSAA